MSDKFARRLGQQTRNNLIPPLITSQNSSEDQSIDGREKASTSHDNTSEKDIERNKLKEFEEKQRLDEEERRLEEVKRRENEQLLEEVKRREEQQRLEEAKRQEEEQQRLEEAKRQEEEQQRLEEAKRREEEQQRLEEVKRREEEQQRLEEAKRREEEQRLEEERKAEYNKRFEANHNANFINKNFEESHRSNREFQYKPFVKKRLIDTHKQVGFYLEKPVLKVIELIVGKDNHGAKYRLANDAFKEMIYRHYPEYISLLEEE